jgi:hypothetical protein
MKTKGKTMRRFRERRQEPSRRHGLRMARRSDDLEGLGLRTFYQGRGWSCLVVVPVSSSGVSCALP